MIVPTLFWCLGPFFWVWRHFPDAVLIWLLFMNIGLRDPKYSTLQVLLVVPLFTAKVVFSIRFALWSWTGSWRL